MMSRISRPNINSVSQSGQQAGNSLSLKDAKELFINELKQKYKQRYNSVQHLPCNRTKLSCVNESFINVGIDISEGSWRPLGSHRRALSIAFSQYKRLIVLGEPGCGNSMLTTQCTYDWCNGTNESYFKDVDILVVLRLRQVGSISSIYRAIRKATLRNDSRLSDNDIQNVIEGGYSTVLILDGLDEYADVHNDKSDIIKIIAGEILQNLKVITTSRHLFRVKAPQTGLLRLAGIDGESQDEYLRKAVVGNDDRAVKNLKERLQGNDLLHDLSQIPFFFVMLAHLNHAGNDFRACKTLTDVFGHVIQCFYSLARHKGTGTITKKQAFWKFEDDHRKLDEMAFKGLSGRNQHVRWRKEILREKLGKAFYDQCVQIGVLVEEEIGYQTEVRFYHKIFCEWYAAHFIAADRYENKPSLENMHPCDLQYFYRFVCGLNPSMARNIIESVKSFKNGDLVAILCISELQGQVQDILDSVADLCSREITIDDRHSDFLKRSMIHLLEIASTAKISISSLELRNCFRSVDIFSGNLHLRVHISIPSSSLSNIKQLWIEEEGRSFTEIEVTDILKYAEAWLRLKSLWFRFCLLPCFFKSKSASLLLSRGVEVFWIPDFAGRIYTLTNDGRQCMWKHGEGTMMDAEYKIQVEKIHHYRMQQMAYTQANIT